MELTHDQHVLLSHWHRYGGSAFVVKVKHGWIITSEGIAAPLGDVPTVFKTKREAVAFVDNLLLIRSKQWRGLDPYAVEPEPPSMDFSQIGRAIRLEAAYEWDSAYMAEHGRTRPLSRNSWYRSAWAENLRKEGQ